METVVANAGPLMALAKLNLLHLLKQLYSKVQFPRSVYEEVVIEGIRQGFEDAHTLQRFLKPGELEADSNRGCARRSGIFPPRSG